MVPRADYWDEHPAWAHLIVEVANSSVPLDRNIEQGIYAAAGIPEYWIVNLVDEQIEVHSGLRDGAYTERTVVVRGGAVCPREFPDVALAVDELLPPRRQ